VRVVTRFSVIALVMAAVAAAAAQAADSPEQRVDNGPDYEASYGAHYRPDSVTRWQPYIDEASRRFGIPASWIARVMRAESAGQTRRDGRPIRSRAGAMGLMQLMPATWAEMHVRLGLGSDPDEPRANILAGTFYLRLMYDRFGYPGLFGAYNAGPARYAAYLDGQQALPGETKAYLAQVAGRVDRHIDGRASVAIADVSGRPAAPLRSLLFAVRRDGPADAAGMAEPPMETGLFAIRKRVP
jgi:soluble lytic murein transglycosylase-like protein